MKKNRRNVGWYKIKPILKFPLIIFLTFLVSVLNAQEIPLVFDVENTGAECEKPILPTIDELPVVEPLTDPFEWSDGSGRVQSYDEWKCRRSEISYELQNYEIGEKPGRPDSMSAVFEGNMLTVTMVHNNETMQLHASISLPEGEGPFPAIIGIGFGTGSLPGQIFSSRNIATIAYNYSEVMAHTQDRGNEPINRLYPELVYMGAYSAWSWGVSRIIDGLEMVADDLPIDLKHLAISGCSFAGKMALWAGAFDERIALTIAQEPGGGGAAAWRVSETVGDVEKLSATSSAWFITDMFKFGGKNVAKLPMDHHELMTMIAPRALLVLGNSDMVWLAEESGFVSCMAANEVWKAFGIEDRMGFSIVGGHGHCALPEVQFPEVEAFVDKFLLGDTTVNTNYAISPYVFVDHAKWYEWWGNEEPYFPVRYPGDAETVTFEAECETVGESWWVMEDEEASNGAYVMIEDGLNSQNTAPADDAGNLSFTFNVEQDSIYHLFARILIIRSLDDAFWIKMDDQPYVKYEGLKSREWGWVRIDDFDLTAGEHTLKIAYCKDGAKLDKISISVFPYEPLELGQDGENICEPEFSGVGVNDFQLEGYELEQNYPNPLGGKTTISFTIPQKSEVSLILYNALGEEIDAPLSAEMNAGRHELEYDMSGLSSGVYYYTLKANSFVQTRKMSLQRK